MLISEAEELLRNNSINFERLEYANETEYYKHTMPDIAIKSFLPSKVIAWVIRNENNLKNIELQFTEKNGDFSFTDLWFGDFSFELFHIEEEFLAGEILSKISDIRQDSLVFIALYSLTKKGKRWIAGSSYDRNDVDDDLFGELGFQKAMKKIQKKKSFISRLFRIKLQYEVFSWNSYDVFIK